MTAVHKSITFDILNARKKNCREINETESCRDPTLATFYVMNTPCSWCLHTGDQLHTLWRHTTPHIIIEHYRSGKLNPPRTKIHGLMTSRPVNVGWRYLGTISIKRCHHTSIGIDIINIRRSYLYNGNQHTWKDDLYIVTRPSIALPSLINYISSFGLYKGLVLNNQQAFDTMPRAVQSSQIF